MTRTSEGSLYTRTMLRSTGVLLTIPGLLSCGSPAAPLQQPRPTPPTGSTPTHRPAPAVATPAVTPPFASKLDVEALLPELSRYDELPVAPSSRWLEQSPQVWVASGGVCRPAEASADQPREFRLETCRTKTPNNGTQCWSTISVEDDGLHSTYVRCETTTPSGTRGSVDGGSGPALAVLSGSDTELVFGDAWKLWAEPAAVVFEEAPCEPGSADRARSISSSADDQTLYERFGIVEDHRRCQILEGVRLGARRVSDTSSWDRGAGLRRSQSEVDCAAGCPTPAQTHPRVAINAWFEGRRFVRSDQELTTLSIHRTRTACEAAAPTRTFSLPQAECEAVPPG